MVLARAELIDPAARPLLTMLDRMERSLEGQLARQLAAFEAKLDVPAWGASRLAALLVPHLVQCADHAVMIQDRAWGRMAQKEVDTFRAERVSWARNHGAELAKHLDAQTRARIAAAIRHALQENWTPDTLRRRLQQGMVPGLPGISPRTRAELIARTELHNAATYAQQREAQGLAARGADLVKVWTATRDARTRPAHRRAHGQTRELKDDFAVGGRPMARPGDPKGGPHNVIRCFPADVVVQGSALALTRRAFDGELVEIATAAGDKLAGTPNHPILTDRGWLALHLIEKGDYVVCARPGVEIRPLVVDPNIEHMHAKLGDLFGAAAQAGEVHRVARVDVDFHGERPDHDVDIVAAQRGLALGENCAVGQRGYQLKLKAPDLALGSALRVCRARHCLIRIWLAALSGMRGLGQRFARLRRRARHALKHGGASIAGADAVVGQAQQNVAALDLERVGERLDAFASEKAGNDLSSQMGASLAQEDEAAGGRAATNPGALSPSVNGGRWDAEMLADLLGCQPADIELERVVSVSRCVFSGHVFNLEDAKGWYVANRIVAHNCRCVARYMPRSYLGEDRQRSTASVIAVARRAPDFTASVVRMAADMDSALGQIVLRAARRESGWSAPAARAALAAMEAEAAAAQGAGG